jgi:hypothetical protein
VPPRAKKKTKAELEAEAKQAMLTHIRETLVGWYPGKWAEEVPVGPACHCGLRGTKEPCTRHGSSQVQSTRPPQADGDTAAAG